MRASHHNHGMTDDQRRVVDVSAVAGGGPNVDRRVAGHRGRPGDRRLTNARGCAEHRQAWRGHLLTRTCAEPLGSVYGVRWPGPRTGLAVLVSPPVHRGVGPQTARVAALDDDRHRSSPPPPPPPYGAGGAAGMAPELAVASVVATPETGGSSEPGLTTSRKESESSNVCSPSTVKPCARYASALAAEPTKVSPSGRL